MSLQHWLLCFGAASREHLLIVADFANWLSNGRPPWAAYSVMMSVRLIALENQPGVRRVGVGETWRRLMEKCFIRVTGQEAKAACGTEQVAGGVETGIECGINATRLLWKQHSQEEKWGFFHIDVQNAFNEENQTEMLWSVRHGWPSGAQFTFNCYLH